LKARIIVQKSPAVTIQYKLKAIYYREDISGEEIQLQVLKIECRKLEFSLN
jgi:hypothetical protein